RRSVKGKAERGRLGNLARMRPELVPDRMGERKHHQEGPAMSDFSGRWVTTYGLMDLTQSGDQVRGTYGQAASLHGTVSGGRLDFQYQEPNATGEGWFELERYGKFHGQWCAAGTDRWDAWDGQRGFEGVWDTSFGPMRLYHHDDHIDGSYDG